MDTPPDFAPLLQDLQRVTYQTSNGWVPLSAEYMLALSVSETAPSIGGAGNNEHQHRPYCGVGAHGSVGRSQCSANPDEACQHHRRRGLHEYHNSR